MNKLAAEDTPFNEMTPAVTVDDELEMVRRSTFEDFNVPRVFGSRNNLRSYSFQCIVPRVYQTREQIEDWLTSEFGGDLISHAIVYEEGKLENYSHYHVVFKLRKYRRLSSVRRQVDERWRHLMMTAEIKQELWDYLAKGLKTGVSRATGSPEWVRELELSARGIEKTFCQEAYGGGDLPIYINHIQLPNVDEWVSHFSAFVGPRQVWIADEGDRSFEGYGRQPFLIVENPELIHPRSFTV